MIKALLIDLLYFYGGSVTIKIKQSLLLLLFFSASSIAHVDYNPETWLKNYALSTCLAMGYHAQEAKTDAAAAARGYLEFGSYSLAAHTAVKKLAEAWLQKDYPNKTGVAMVAAKCIDLYHSKELSEIILKYKGLDDN